MKRTTNITLLILALVLCLTQCKKNDEQIINANEGEKTHITLSVSQGSSSKLNLDPPHVTFENGDRIYVASNGVYVGYLDYNGSNFEGEISGATEGLPLHFYLLGNVKPTETLTAGTTTTCSVLIGDQTSNKPVIAYNASNENFGATTSFTSTLKNKCALVKFDVTTSSDGPTFITGFNNKVTVDFSSNTLTPSKQHAGTIKLGAGNGEKWAILLPQEAKENSNAFSGAYYGTCAAVPQLTGNEYLTVGISVNIDTPVPEGATPGVFTINADGDLAFFSKGNLQYIGSASNPYWKFANNQWDILGTSTGQNSNNHNVDRDLFGWGTSGWNNGNGYYMPYETEVGWYRYNYGYGPTDGTNYNYDLTGTYANADWGVYNAISNGGNTAGQWRTLSRAEWEFVVLNDGILQSRKIPAIIHDTKGYILLPDSYYGYVIKPTGSAYQSISDVNWTGYENSGAVFIPNAGCRIETTYNNDNNNISYYWSSSMISGAPSTPDNSGGSNRPYCIDLNNFYYTGQSSWGCAVRLVQVAH